MQRIFNLLRANEMNMAVKSACGEDAPFTSDGFSARPDDDVHTGLGVGITCLANRRNAPVFQPDIRLQYSAMIDNQRIGDHRIHGPFGAGGLRLSHPVADDLAPAKFDLFTVSQRICAVPAGCGSTNQLGRQIALNLDYQIRIGQPQFVTNRGAKHSGIGTTRDLAGHIKASLKTRLFHSAPMTR